MKDILAFLQFFKNLKSNFTFLQYTKYSILFCYFCYIHGIVVSSHIIMLSNINSFEIH